MQRHELLNAITNRERELDRNPYHIAGSRKKHLGAFSLTIATDEALEAFLAHLENEMWMASVGKMGKKQLELIMEGE